MLRLVNPTDQEMPGQEERIVLLGLDAAGGTLRVCVCTGHQNGEAFFLQADEITGADGERTAPCPRCEVVHAVMGFLEATQENRLDLNEGVYCIPATLLITSSAR